jgi:uncharacterized membrane protein YoaK (UPF0700 family)
MIPQLRGWTSVQRTTQNNIRLGATLCFVAGATNAGGFLAVGQYTSHMTGIVSSVADHLVMGQVVLALAGLFSLLAFISGAMTSAWMVNWALRRNLQSAYGRPLLLEAALLLVFGLFGAGINFFAGLFVPLTVLVLCFIMGLQNAVITKISNAEIRTTHVTGLVTDLGIELGKLFYINRLTRDKLVQANRRKLRIHATLICSFFVGGLLGAIGFKTIGYISTVPLSILLLLLVWHPVLNDAKNWMDTEWPQNDPERGG